MRTSTPARKRSYHHGDLARALVGAALAIIEKKGPDALTLREAAAAIGVTHGAAYRHFEDKTALLAAIAEDGYLLLAQRLEGARQRDVRSSRTRFRGIASEYVAFALERPAYYRVMWGARLNEDGRFPALERAIEAVSAVLVAELEEGQKNGSIRAMPPRDLAVTIWFFSHGFVDLVLRRRIKVRSTATALEYFERLLDPLLDGFFLKTRAR